MTTYSFNGQSGTTLPPAPGPTQTPYYPHPMETPDPSLQAYQPPQATYDMGGNAYNPAQAVETTQATGGYETWPTIPGQPGRRDPSNGQCYYNGQKAHDSMCGGNIPLPDTTQPDPGDGPITPPPITVTPTPGGNGGGGTSPPPYTGGMPNIDPYAVPPSPTQEATGVGGISAINPQATPFDYGQVSDFADAAWNQSKRYLDPQFQLQDRRFEQSLINKGIDPDSEAGQAAFQRKSMGQNDLLSKSAFDALGFGTGVQDQMFGQAATRSGLSAELLQAMMGLNQRGHEFDVTAGLNANQQAFAQMLGLEGLDYRDYMTLIDQMRYDDSLSLALLGMGAPPGYQTVNTGLGSAPYADLNNETNLWNTPLFGS